ncbi:hypothetical protein [Actinokineospora sp. HUAS TT18]|uniref:hypothetical protein n=1 Tax=Actinokineospora sp. HUAS TT18 TaxID=3447451 RepID=UPI003F51C457
MPEAMTGQPRRAVLARVLVALFLIAGALFGLHCASDGPQAGHAATHVTDAVVGEDALTPVSHDDGAPGGLLALCVSVTVAVLFVCAKLSGALDVHARVVPPRGSGVSPAVLLSRVDLTRLCVLRA